MNHIYADDRLYSYEKLESDIIKNLLQLNKEDMGLHVLEPNLTYNFIVKYLSLQRSKHSVFLVEKIDDLKIEILNQLDSVFNFIFIENKKKIVSSFNKDKTLDDVELMLSSGTSLKKKIVVIKKNTIWDNVDRINEQFKVDESVCELVVMPLHHSFGITRLRCGLKRKSNIYLSKKLLDSKMLKKCFLNEKKIFLGAVSKAMELFVSYFGRYIKKQNNIFFYLESGSMEISKSILDSINENFTNYLHFHHYGSTESSRSFFSGTKDLNKNIRNIGQISQGLNYKIKNNELLIKGNSLFQGYLSEGKVSYKLDNENLVTKDGYFKTGDYVKFDNEILLFESRKKDIVNLNGLKYSPLILENEILKNSKELIDVVVIQYPGDQDYFIVYELNNIINNNQEIILKINNLSKKLFQIKPVKIFNQKIVKTNSGKKIRKHELYSDRF
jgi:long-subunit acyl-CoA synthetase (AMP-forming)